MRFYCFFIHMEKVEAGDLVYFKKFIKSKYRACRWIRGFKTFLVKGSLFALVRNMPLKLLFNLVPVGFATNYFISTFSNDVMLFYAKNIIWQNKTI